ncbi:MAG: hypothetical protein AAGB04_29235 [Pseudomonadota bacterium]
MLGASARIDENRFGLFVLIHGSCFLRCALFSHLGQEPPHRIEITQVNILLREGDLDIEFLEALKDCEP